MVSTFFICRLDAIKNKMRIMNSILKKLSYKDQNPVLILNAPEEYSPILKEFSSQVDLEVKGKYNFIQVFAIDSKEAERLTKKVFKAIGDKALLWFCYPKGTSKKYKSDIKRDNCAKLFAEKNYEPVAQIAIDEDWSAMRFKSVDAIKTMKRKSAFSEEGKKRIARTSKKK
jgi:hypothetical protein